MTSPKSVPLSHHKKGFWLKLLVHLAAAVPVVVLGIRALGNDLGFNPIQTITRFSGRAALVFLLLSLAVTPIRFITHWDSLRRIRRNLGLYAFFYALAHLLIYLVIDLGFDWGIFFNSIFTNRFFLVGSFAFIILLILAITSIPALMRKMGRAWVWVHRLAYIAGGLVVLHYAWVEKGNLFTGQGRLAWPLVAGGVLILLLLLRIPYWISRSRKK